MKRRTELGAGQPADDDRFDPRQVAFEVFGILVVENLADHRAQDRIAQEFQAFVRSQAVFGAGGMRQGRQKHALVLKFIADPLLQLVEQ